MVKNGVRAGNKPPNKLLLSYKAPSDWSGKMVKNMKTVMGRRKGGGGAGGRGGCTRWKEGKEEKTKDSLN